MRFIFIIFLTCQVKLLATGISYVVEFIGVKDPVTLKAIKANSELASLKKHPPASINALRYRAESDIPHILKVLHACGYYEATAETRVEEEMGKVKAIVSIQTGPLYTLQEYKVVLYCNTKEQTTCCPRMTMEELGIALGCPATGKRILEAELKALEVLGECGYPLAEIAHREVIADGATKSISIELQINTEALARFGELKCTGLKEVRQAYLLQKLSWKEGEVYDSRLIETTQKALMDSGLFSSVIITHGQTLDATGRIDMRIDITESKHKNINIGISYQTVFGPGVTFGMENRNVSGMGRRFSFQGDITKISQTGTATFLLPDYKRKGQDLNTQAIAMRENLFAYNDRSYSLTERLDRILNGQTRFAVGARVERLFVTDSVDNGNFTLLEAPFYLRWSSANSLLNPTKGMTLEYQTVPTVNLGRVSQYYLYQEIGYALYSPVTSSQFLVIAQKITFGSILSSNLNAVPIPKRFLGGSEEELRGYRYRTVSPLKECLPEGGRSAIYYTIETRFRLSQTIGLVPFFDLGNVYTTQLPKLTGKWFKSTGIGLRYFSFIGPLRLDVAFPLDRRKGIDPFYRFLVSIGQTF